MLYESLIHPDHHSLDAALGRRRARLLALMLCGIDLSLVSFIGIILLMGIVKKNAIMMIDFALDAERNEDLSPEDAIYKACVIRFRPDHDDHDGRAVRRGAAGHRHGHRLRTAPAAGHRGRRRPDCSRRS